MNSNKGSNNSYWGNIQEAVSSLWTGLKITLKHLMQSGVSRKPIGISDDKYFDQKTGLVTLQYPKESLPIPDNGRYRLHNEIDDCIVCDKCAKICPVNCIEIEPIKAVEEIGKTSDGTTKRIYPAKFDIDMAKCCFCGLCTTVCPTECLTMTPEFDFSEFDVADHNYAFSQMTPLEILEKKQKLEEANKLKEAAKAPIAKPTATNEAPAQNSEASKTSGTGKPAFKPRVPAKPQTSAPEGDAKEDAKAEALKLMQEKGASIPSKPTRPVLKQATAKDDAGKDVTSTDSNINPNVSGNQQIENEASPVKPAKPVFRPKPMIKKQEAESSETPTASPEKEEESKPAAKPVFKPKPMIRKPAADNNVTPPTTQENKTEDKPAENKPIAKPVFKPRPVIKKEATDEAIDANAASTQPEKPTEKKSNDAQEDKTTEASATPKPVYRPKPVIRKTPSANQQEAEAQPTEPETPAQKEEEKPAAKPVFKPRPVIRKKPDNNE